MTARHYPPRSESVTLARRFVAHELREIDPDLREVAALATSELASNAVRHAATGFDVEVECSDTEVRVVVSDQGEGVPAVQHPGPETPSGRGLAIVEHVTDAWGVEAEAGDGHRIWFVLRLPEPAVPVHGPA